MLKINIEKLSHFQRRKKNRKKLSQKTKILLRYENWQLNNLIYFHFFKTYLQGRDEK